MLQSALIYGGEFSTIKGLAAGAAVLGKSSAKEINQRDIWCVLAVGHLVSFQVVISMTFLLTFSTDNCLSYGC